VVNVTNVGSKTRSLDKVRINQIVGAEASAQIPDIVFETTNASAQSFGDHD